MTTLEAYRPQAGAYDEMVGDDRVVRPHWRYLAGALATLGVPALHDRLHEARRLLRESGATYNVYGDPQGPGRPWQLDPIPVLVSSDEWREIEWGLVQRAEVLDLVLKDVYGPQRLVRSGLLPMELVYEHAGFLRPCHPLRVAGAHALIVYAATVARGGDGRVRVLSDRTQAPSGAGYALENRVVLSRVLPSLYRDSHVHRLSLFFQNMRASLAALAQGRRAEPRVVVLTPGPFNETYFEHTYLASYLGYTLARGADLTVQDGHVWLRAMRRLEPVDVILRRVDDDYCDPLELHPDSTLGIPGLAEAARRGTVVLANPLGSSVLENPALSAFLPAIARHFLGRDLQLPSIETWWCGRPADRAYVLAHLDRLVIRPLDRTPRSLPIFASTLDAEARRELAARIRARPQAFVAQEHLHCSAVPTLAASGIEGRQAVIRTFLVARHDGYVVMPGALTRIAASQDSVLVSNQAGALSKDTWILASEPEKQVSLLATVTPVSPVAPDPNAAPPGGAAENLFWLGRYGERAEQGTRVVRTVLRQYRNAHELRDPDRGSLDDLLAAVTHVTGTYPGFVGEATAERRGRPLPELLSIVVDAERVGSVAFDLRGMLAAAYAVRDRLSGDTWRVVHDVRRRLERLHHGAALATDRIHDTLGDALDGLVTDLAAAFALAQEGMVHDQAWVFLETGRRLERALLLIALLRATVVRRHAEVAEAQIVSAVLRATESLLAYRRRHHEVPRVAPALGLLLFDETNPRSLGFQLEQVHRSIRRLSRDEGTRQLAEEERLVLDAATSLRLADPGSLGGAASDDGVRHALDALLARIGDLLRQASEVLSRQYFTDVRGPQHLAQVVPDGVS